MKATPGGMLPVDEIFGRDAFIDQLWRSLDRNSVRMEAERRIGKTCVLRKMTEQPFAGVGSDIPRSRKSPFSRGIRRTRLH